MTSVLAGLIVIFDRPLLAPFLGGRSPALPIAEHIQIVMTWSFVAMGVMMVLGGTMRAYGGVMVPLVIMVISLYPARMGFYFLVFPIIGSEALWWFFPLGSVVSGFLTRGYFRSGA